MAKQSHPKIILGLDVGSVRIGVAVANSLARLPRPVSIITSDEHVFAVINDLAAAEGASLIVAGLPRNMDGLETKQSQAIRKFVKNLKDHTAVPVVFADESLSSRRAEEGSRRYKSTFPSKYLDDVAACLILEEFFNGAA